MVAFAQASDQRSVQSSSRRLRNIEVTDAAHHGSSRIYFHTDRKDISSPVISDARDLRFFAKDFLHVRGQSSQRVYLISLNSKGNRHGDRRACVEASNVDGGARDLFIECAL
jgi:hypothetical protein